MVEFLKCTPSPNLLSSSIRCLSSLDLYFFLAFPVPPVPTARQINPAAVPPTRRYRWQVPVNDRQGKLPCQKTPGTAGHEGRGFFLTPRHESTLIDFCQHESTSDRFPLVVGVGIFFSKLFKTTRIKKGFISPIVDDDFLILLVNVNYMLIFWP